MDEEDKEFILLRTRQLWEETFSKGETIFITGATGFFGKCLLESFIYINEELKLEAQIVVLTRNISAFLLKYPQFENRAIKFIEGDLNTFEYPYSVVEYIIHAANENDEDSDVDSRPIIKGTNRLLNFAKEKKVKSFLYTSSGAVYGSKPIWRYIKEDDQDNVCLPSVDHYAINKRRIEDLCNEFYQNDGVPVKIARCFAFVGPYLDLDIHYAIGNFIRNYLDNTSIIIKGDGKVYRSYLYSADLCIWIWTILFRGKSGRPYNVGSDKYFTLLEIANKVIGGRTTEMSVKVLNESVSSNQYWYIPDVQRAREELQLEIYTSIDKAIKKTILFNQKQHIQ